MVSSPVLRLGLLDGFKLFVDDRPVEVARGSQRLLALLAISGGELHRTTVHGLLWPERDDKRAAGNLRSAVYRLPVEARHAVISSTIRIGLDPSVRCDVVELLERTRRMIDGEQLAPEDYDLSPLLHDLLPAWYDDWVLLERERLRQRRMHALERLSEQLTAVGRFGEAVEAGLAAVAADPLRESAHLRVISAHLAEGNRSEALRQYEHLAEVLRESLGIAPSAPATAMIDQAMGSERIRQTSQDRH